MSERLVLEQLEPTLPSHYYFDAEHHAREMDVFWNRHWICVGTASGIGSAGDYKVVDVDDQSIVITRASNGELHGFHNTCRHRGSILCEQDQGTFHNECVVCPYHAWTYSLDGDLLRTPRRLPSDDFDASNFSLYRIGVFEWAGFVFINLGTEENASAESALEGMPSRFSNWQLDSAAIGHSTSVELACNWKVFWENFEECYHCPGVHPELCQIVPLYGHGWTSASDNPEWTPPTADVISREPRLAPGATTWSMDGKPVAPEFSGLDPDEKSAGHTYGVSMPSCYFVAHIDYARMVHMLPLGPETTRLSIHWLFNPQTLAQDEVDVEKIIALGKLVVEQDGRACELNQRGLRSRRHANGVLVPQEYSISHFHRWIREQLATN
jgi:Rieske 2Fe-2S family protein